MAKKVLSVYQRLFFDRLLLIGIIFLAVSYILHDSWGGAFAESATFIIGILWAHRAATTNPRLMFRLVATLVLVLIGCLLALYLGRVNGLV